MTPPYFCEDDSWCNGNIPYCELDMPMKVMFYRKIYEKVCEIGVRNVDLAMFLFVHFHKLFTI